MENDVNVGRDEYERLDASLTETDPADRASNDDNDIARRDRHLGSIIDSLEPADSDQQGEAVYADTDMNPNADDQRDAHSASD